jgi:hypothetical protein
MRSWRLALMGAAGVGMAGAVGGVGLQACGGNSCDFGDCVGSGDASTDATDAVADKVTSDQRSERSAPDGHVEGGGDVTHPDAETGPAPCPSTDVPSQNPCVISEKYGVFVAPLANGGSTSGDGSREHPYATFAAAIPAAVTAGKRVYACGATYTEALSVAEAMDGVSIYGGLQCPVAGDGGVADSGTIDSSTGPWSYNGAAASVAPGATGFALDVESLTKGATFEDMAFTAISATATAYGTSSVAVLVNSSANVSFVRVSAIAGDGALGAPGGAVTASNHCASSLAGSATSTSSGGAGGYCTDTATAGNCPVYGSSGGAVGGGGGMPGVVGGNGSSSPATTLMVVPYDGLGGAGGSSSDAFTCGNGHSGANGSPRSGGSAGPAGSLGSTGWQAATAGAGMAGNPGEGGGGGGGEYGTGSLGGAGGGAGGCGGNGAAGGGGGGASLGFALVSSSVTFTAVVLQTGTGGTGGMGAQGEQGQGGGAGGSMGVSECFGGSGGQGAGGSGGGGGAGGPSIGIAWTGTTAMAPSIDGTTQTTTTTLPSGPSKYTSGTAGGSGPGGLAGIAAAGDLGNPGQAGDAGTGGSMGALGAVQEY